MTSLKHIDYDDLKQLVEQAQREGTQNGAFRALKYALSEELDMAIRYCVHKKRLSIKEDSELRTQSDNAFFEVVSDFKSQSGKTDISLRKLFLNQIKMKFENIVK